MDKSFSKFFLYLRLGAFLFICFSILAAAYLIQTNQTRIKKSRASGPLTAEGKDLDSTCSAAKYDYCSQAPKCPDGSWNETIAKAMWNIDIHNYCGTESYYCKGYVPFCCYEMVRTGDKDYCQGYDTLSCLPSQCEKVSGAGSKNCAHGLKYYCPKDHGIDVSNSEPVPLSQRFPNDIIFYRLNKAAENEINLVKQKQPQLWDLYQAYKASGGPWYPPAGEPPLGGGVSPTSSPISAPTSAPTSSPTVGPGDPTPTSGSGFCKQDGESCTASAQCCGAVCGQGTCMGSTGQTVSPTPAPTATPMPLSPVPTSSGSVNVITPFTQQPGQQEPTQQSAAPATPTPAPVPYNLKAIVTIENKENVVLQKGAVYVFAGNTQLQKINLNHTLPSQEITLNNLMTGSDYAIKAYVGSADGKVYTQTNQCSRSNLFESCLVEGPSDSVSIVINVVSSADKADSVTGVSWLDLILNTPKNIFQQVISYDKLFEKKVTEYIPFLKNLPSLN